MAKLVDVYRPSKTLSRRQLPLVVDETLTMVMDLKSLGLVSDSQQVKGKELEDFSRKMGLLSDNELNEALKVSRTEIIHVLNQSVPCVGCRRSVERLYYQLCKFEYPTFDPLMITSEGIVTIREDKHGSPQFVCSLFHGHSARLNNLVDSQPRRNKKSHRCLLHSLDSQRSRPITPVWRDVWDCMRLECRRDVCIIEASSLRVTLETYLRKHRFCGECRTKVQKAYSLLIEDPEPRKEKGYVTALYAGIKRCIQEKHIHLPTKTEYIAKLIGRAEPELLGSRRERHAKTLEIAQEEVLTCIGICMYERLHRIYMRMREEECTCQVFAAVAVDALCRSFETAVESKQGISQLELLYAELTREEQQKQIRKEAKKLKRKRKKGKGAEQNGKENCHGYDGAEFDEKDEIEKECRCKVDKNEPLNCLNCEELSLNKQSGKCNGTKSSSNNNKKPPNTTVTEGGGECGGGGGGVDEWLSPCKLHDVKKKDAVYKCDNGIISSGGGGGEGVVGSAVEYSHKKDGCRDHSHDCGYSSENNNGCCETESLTSSIPSSPDGSEIACSDGCCQRGENDVEEAEFGTLGRFTYGNNSHQLSLEQMLEDHCYSDDNDCYITPEEVHEFKSNNRQVYEVRQQLRETLRTRFAQLCANGPLQVPRFLVQSKYASN